MKTVEDLGREIKARNPKYKKYHRMSDAELGRRKKRKFPGQYDEYIDIEESLSKTEPVTAETNRANPFQNLNPDYERKIQYIWNKIDPRMGGIVAWILYHSFNAKSRFFDKASEVERQVLSQALIITEHIANGVKQERDLQRFVEENRNAIEAFKHHTNLMQLADVDGVSLELYLKKKEAEFDSKLRTEELEREKHIELEARWKEIMQDLNAADMEVISTRLVIKKMRDELITTRRERYQEEISDDPKELKEAILEDYDNYIGNLQKQINATEARLLQEENR